MRRPDNPAGARRRSGRCMQRGCSSACCRWWAWTCGTASCRTWRRGASTRCTSSCGCCTATPSPPTARPRPSRRAAAARRAVARTARRCHGRCWCRWCSRLVSHHTVIFLFLSYCRVFLFLHPPLAAFTPYFLRALYFPAPSAGLKPPRGGGLGLAGVGSVCFPGRPSDLLCLSILFTFVPTLSPPSLFDFLAVFC